MVLNVAQQISQKKSDGVSKFFLIMNFGPIFIKLAYFNSSCDYKSNKDDLMI